MITLTFGQNLNYIIKNSILKFNIILTLLIYYE